jgi:hypothetical protein
MGMVTMIANASYKITGWDEKTWDGKGWNEVEGAKLTHAKVSRVYEGDIVGASTTHYLMYYRDDGTVHITGLEQFAGSLHGKQGSFVLEHRGVVEDDIVKGNWHVVFGSGAGDLKGLEGRGENAISHAESYPFVLDYSLT